MEPNGYLPSQYQSADTDPGLDADLSAFAKGLSSTLASSGKGRLLLTFGAEMNGNWTDWGCLPKATYVAFYRKFHGLVSAALAAESPAIDPRRVRWVYGPNSTSSGGCGTAVDYYPGHAYVDYIGMSAYRTATASVSSAVTAPANALLSGLGYPPAWQSDRFIVLQTGTQDIAGDDRGAWLADLYGALTADSAFLGVIYFNSDKWAVLGPGAPPQPLTGYGAFVAALKALPLADRALDATFETFFWDVHQANRYYPEVQSLRAAGISSGCGADPPLFCPDDPRRGRDPARPRVLARP